MQNRYGKNSYIRAIMLLSVLVIAFVLYRSLIRDGLPGGLAGLLNADFEAYRNLSRFEEPQQVEIRNKLAGFWEYSQGNPDEDPVSKTERLELIDNGIVWHIVSWVINLPSGAQNTLFHARQAYFTPFSYSQDTSLIYCEALVVRQIFISGKDTCYGENHELEMWEMDIEENLLHFNNRVYSRYEGELADFFQDNRLLRVVDQIDLGPCEMGTTLRTISKGLIAENPGEVEAGKREAVINSMIEMYYRPLIIEEFTRNQDQRTVPDSVNLTLVVSRDGAVTNIRNHSTGLTTVRFNRALSHEIQSWVFPSSESDETFSITLPVK